MTITQDLADLKEVTRQLTPWTERPGWVDRVRRSVEQDRIKRLGRENKLPQEPATPEQLQQFTGHLKDVLTEQGEQKPPLRVQSMLSTYGAKACPSCLEVLNRETGFYSGDSYCKACAAERGAEYRAANREEILQRQREAYAADPEKHRQRTRRWMRENPEHVQEYRRDHRERRPLVKKLYSGYQRALKAGNPAEYITTEEILDYWESVGIDSTRCYFTGVALDSSNISIDHGTPISRGGGHVLENLFPCTVAANLDKNTRTVAEYQEKE